MINFRNILKITLGILPTFLLCLRLRKVNLEKKYRAKQFAMPILGLVFSIALMINIRRIKDLIHKLVWLIPKLIVSLISSLGFENVANTAASTVASIYNMINWDLWSAFVVNAVVIIAYIAIKRIALGIIKRVVTNENETLLSIASIMYDFDSDRQAWFVKESFVDVRRFFKIAFYSALGIASALMYVTKPMVENHVLSDVFYPAYIAILIGELYFYFDGFTKAEFLVDIYGENDAAIGIANYSLMRTRLRKLFKENLMEEGTSVNNDINYLTNNEILNKYNDSNDQAITSFTTFYKNKVKKGMVLDQNYFQSSLELLQDKSILFNNPFYYDLIPYIFYPINRKLLAGKKVLIVLGRHGIEEEIIEWAKEGVKSITNLPYMWKTGVLNSERFEGDIGILSRSSVANLEVLSNNEDFFNDVEFIVIIEPNKLITTAQVGLNMTIRKCREKDPNKHITFCMCDKNCDGLVDSMSHILLESIAEVSATNKHKGTVSHMTWDTSDIHLHHKITPNISRYLGEGTELSFVALKNQIKKTKWFGGEAYPVVDQKWIAKQYYHELAKYAELPSNQGLVDEMFETSSAFWNAAIEKNSYITVEDESYNLYEVLREFSTRSVSQGFVNVISSEYLLKDYMAGNARIFEIDAKAIPTIVADYAKTKRNVTLGLLLRLSDEEILEDDIVHEFSLIGIAITDVKKQLWFEIYKFFAGIEAVKQLSNDYEKAVDEVAGKTIKVGRNEFNLEQLIRKTDRYNYDKEREEIFYSLNKEYQVLKKELINNIQSAAYIAEDEFDSDNYLGSELVSHVYQRYLPGQYLVLSGKNYQMKGLTANNEIVVRRAADHIDNRYYYRQVRNYHINSIGISNDALDNRNISGVIVKKEYADISVDTPSYFSMARYNDMKNAKHILFDEENAKIPTRVYKNKQMLRICITDSGEKAKGINYTLALLINEVFRSIFAENQAYISAVTSFDRTNDRDPQTFTVDSKDELFDENSIYIIEDSQLDLGLLEAVERNIDRIMEIVCDYISWHRQTLEESLNPKGKETEESMFEEKEEEEKKEGFFKRIGHKVKNFFKKLFGKKNGKEETETDNSELAGDKLKETEEKKESFFKRLFGKNKKNEETAKKLEDAETESEEEATVEPETSDGSEELIIEGEDEELTEETDSPEDETEDETEDEIKVEEDNEEVPETVDFKMSPRAKAMIKAMEDNVEKEKTKSKKKSTKVQKEINIEGQKEDEISTQKVEEPASEPQTKEPEVKLEPAKEEDTVIEVEEDKAQKVNKEEEPSPRKPYHQRFYTLYGHDEQPSEIMLDDLYDLLVKHGFDNNSLKQAREGKSLTELVKEGFVPNKEDAIYCDFCGSEITGIEYEKLSDGRDRCMVCSRTAIKNEKEFKELYEEVKRNMESFFSIKLETDIRIEMVNASKLHKKRGKKFVPTSKADARTLGFARRDKNGFSIVLENGSPKMMTMLTLAHELTHIWQYCNWDLKAIKKKYGSIELEVYEGMAKWVEIQYAYLINEQVTAVKEEIQTMARDDEYGRGYLRYKENYPITEETVLFGLTPFVNKEEPLQNDFCGRIKK